MTAELRRASASAEALRRNGYQVDLRGLLEGLRKGVIGVRAEAAFLLGQPPHLRHPGSLRSFCRVLPGLAGVVVAVDVQPQVAR